MSQRINGIHVGRRADRLRKEMQPIDTGGKRSVYFHGDDVAHEARMEANCRRVDEELAWITEAGLCAVEALLAEPLYERMTWRQKKQGRIQARLEAETAAGGDTIVGCLSKREWKRTYAQVAAFQAFFRSSEGRPFERLARAIVLTSNDRWAEMQADPERLALLERFNGKD